MANKLEHRFKKVDEKNTAVLNDLSKDELIQKIQTLQAHNLQLRNILTKGSQSRTNCENKNQKNFNFSKCVFRRVLLKFFYLGWDYSGYVVQEDTTNTIEFFLFEALIKTCLIKDRTSSNYHRCGRTDKGVSSYGQVISIDLRSKLSLEVQNDCKNEIDYCKILNKVLPSNIRCVAWCPIEQNFSARFDCNSRTYKYFFPKADLNIEKMKTASSYLIGVHDYRNFCKMDVGNGVVEFVRNITLINIELVGNDPVVNEYSMYVMTIKGKAFLWHQIRCIMGILFLIGENKEEPEVINEFLDVSKNPRKPEYSMASEVPLNLFACDYDVHNWHWDVITLGEVIHKLKSIWTDLNVKATMTKYMLNDLESLEAIHGHEKLIMQPTLIQGVKAKKYIPLLQRQKCESLEDKMKRFGKRRKITIKETMSDQLH